MSEGKWQTVRRDQRKERKEQLSSHDSKHTVGELKISIQTSYLLYQYGLVVYCLYYTCILCPVLSFMLRLAFALFFCFFCLM